MGFFETLGRGFFAKERFGLGRIGMKGMKKKQPAFDEEARDAWMRENLGGLYGPGTPDYGGPNIGDYGVESTGERDSKGTGSPSPGFGFPLKPRVAVGPRRVGLASIKQSLGPQVAAPRRRPPRDRSEYVSDR